MGEDISNHQIWKEIGGLTTSVNHLQGEMEKLPTAFAREVERSLGPLSERVAKLESGLDEVRARPFLTVERARTLDRIIDTDESGSETRLILRRTWLSQLITIPLLIVVVAPASALLTALALHFVR